MKLIKLKDQYIIVDDYNITENYDSRIKKGMHFYKDDSKDIVVAEYSTASKVSRPIIASTEKYNGLPLFSLKLVEELLFKNETGRKFTKEEMFLFFGFYTERKKQGKNSEETFKDFLNY